MSGGWWVGAGQGSIGTTLAGLLKVMVPPEMVRAGESATPTPVDTPVPEPTLTDPSTGPETRAEVRGPLERLGFLLGWTAMISENTCSSPRMEPVRARLWRFPSGCHMKLVSSTTLLARRPSSWGRHTAGGARHPTINTISSDVRENILSDAQLHHTTPSVR